jgi:hypothetical protein
VIWAHPLALWVLPLAAAPLLWHLFFKPKRRAAAFPSLMFFLQRQPRLEGRRKLREWLILAARCLLVALLVLALAGPRLPAAGGSGAPALAIVIDTSASMARTDASGRPLARLAAETAVALIDALPAGGRAVIVPTAPDPALALPTQPSGDRASLAAALDRLSATEAAGDAAGAIARAAAALAQDDAVDREIRILSDLQAGEWDVQARLPAMPAGVRITVHPLRAATSDGGIGLGEVIPPPGRSVAGRPARLGVELVNRGRADATATLRITTPDAGESMREAAVAAGTSLSLPIVLTPANPGTSWAFLQLDGSGIARRAGVAVWAHDRVAALLAAPASSLGPLPLALAPDGSGALSGIVPTAFAATLLPRAGLVVATWDAVPDVKAWVEAGGTLLLLPASAPAETSVPPAWVGLRPLSAERFDTPMATVLPDQHAACWEHVRDATGAVEVRLRVSRAWPLAGDGARTALALADGRPLLMERTVGRGLVVGLGVAFHPSWSDLPLKGWSLALVQGLALRGAPPARSLELVAGAAFPPATGDRTPVRISTLAGGPLAWQGPREALPAPVRAGVYQIDGAGPQPVIVAVRAAADEAVMRFAEPERAAVLAGLGARSVAITDPAAAVADWRGQRRGLDLMPWLLIAALLCWLGEGLLAARGPR